MELTSTQILGLKLPLRVKLKVAGVFMVGIMTIIAGAARLVIWIQILATAQETDSEDVNLAVTLSLQWGMIEAGLAFIVSQLPALGAVLQKSTRDDMTQTVRRAAGIISIRSNKSGSSEPRSEGLNRDIELSAGLKE